MLSIFLPLLLSLLLVDFGATLAMPPRKRPGAASASGKAPKRKKASAKTAAKAPKKAAVPSSGDDDSESDPELSDTDEDDAQLPLTDAKKKDNQSEKTFFSTSSDATIALYDNYTSLVVPGKNDYSPL